VSGELRKETVVGGGVVRQKGKKGPIPGEVTRKEEDLHHYLREKRKRAPLWTKRGTNNSPGKKCILHVVDNGRGRAVFPVHRQKKGGRAFHLKERHKGERGSGKFPAYVKLKKRNKKGNETFAISGGYREKYCC